MRKPKVGFICVHNSCRSQMAEAIARHDAADVFDCFSAGTETVPEINGMAVKTVKKLFDIDMNKQYSKLLSDLPQLDIVITMGCNVQCPMLPCKYREDWGLNDPTGKSEQEFINTAETIKTKINDLKEKIQNGELLNI